MTCRDEVLDAMRRLERRHNRTDFALYEIVQEVVSAGTTYPEDTIRTEIVARMCEQAPNNHAVTYDDLDRVGRGYYALRGHAQ
jgi:hypothetical protein